MIKGFYRFNSLIDLYDPDSDELDISAGISKPLEIEHLKFLDILLTHLVLDMSVISHHFHASPHYHYHDISWLVLLPLHSTADMQFNNVQIYCRVLSVLDRPTDMQPAHILQLHQHHNDISCSALLVLDSPTYSHFYTT